MQHDHIGMHIGARTHAVKHPEMTVRRALAFVELFDKWADKEGIKDWRDIVTSHPAARS